MKFLVSIVFAIAVAALTQACGKKANPQPEPACHFQQNSYGQRVSWSITPVTMYADLSLTSDQVTSLQDAMDIWNKALSDHRGGKPLFVFGGVLQSQVGLKTDGQNVVSVTSNWTGDSTEQAETLLTWADTMITEADIRVNGLKPLSASDVTQSNEIDMVALFVHELGHVLGLVHIQPSEDEPYTVMNPYLARGDTDRREIGPVELNALECEY